MESVIIHTTGALLATTATTPYSARSLLPLLLLLLYLPFARHGTRERNRASRLVQVRAGQEITGNTTQDQHNQQHPAADASG